MTSVSTFSVITPSLDQVAYIAEAIDSVSRQDGVEVEHIVIDGGSADGTIAVLERALRGDRSRWSSEPDAGQSDAVNKGLAAAGGELIGWLNADDRYLPGALAKVAAAFAADPLADVVYGDCEAIDADGRHLRDLPAYGLSVRGLLLHEFRLYQPSFFYRKRLFDAIGGLDTSLHYVMDHELFLRIAAAHRRSVTLRTALAQHRIHGEAKSRRAAEAFMPEYLSVLDRFYSRAEIDDDARALRERAYQVVALEGGQRSLEADDRAEARRRLARAIGLGLKRPDPRLIRALLLFFDALTGTSFGQRSVGVLRAIGRRS